MKLSERENFDLVKGMIVLVGYAYYQNGKKRVRFSMSFRKFNDAKIVAERFDKGENYWEIANKNGVVDNA